MPEKTKQILVAIYVLATVQFAWCYLWITRPYVNTALYEAGRERMPFQGRVLMMYPLRWAHQSSVFHWFAAPFAHSHFWFPKPVQPEVLVQAIVNVLCLLIAGLLTTRLYQASSRHAILAPVVYPLFLVSCAATYVLHTVQNFRFVYDLPSLAFFTGAMYLLYFRKPLRYFVLLFLVATVNRETTLLLLPLYLINFAVEDGKDGKLRWSRLLNRQPWLLVLPLAAFWAAWQVFIRHAFRHNVSEFYPRIDWNLKSLLVPQAWPQLLSTCGYLMIFTVALRRRIPDPRLRAWLLLLPIWFVFMFSFGILIETRVFGELIPFFVCSTALILEQLLIARMAAIPATHVSKPARAAMRVGKAA